MSTPNLRSSAYLSTTASTNFPAPTSIGEGDIRVILRAGEAPNPTHDFYVHRVILSIFSPVFKEMFALPQLPNQSDATPTIPTINVHCSLKTLDAVLQYIYPGSVSEVTDLSTLVDMSPVADTKSNNFGRW